MEQNYLCPKCQGQLCVGEQIVFIVKNRKKQKGIILLHPEIGNYESIKHPDFVFAHGESLEFFCPLCHASLSCDLAENLAHVVLEEKSKMSDIYFSRIAGEQSTFLIEGETVVYTGDHAERYTWFKLNDKYKHFLKR